MAAQRFVRALVDAGHGLSMVFFREDGVYAAVAGRETDPGTPDLHAGWTELQEATETQMLVCSAAAQRRLERAPGDSFREAGLAELADAVQACDRVVSF